MDASPQRSTLGLGAPAALFPSFPKKAFHFDSPASSEGLCCIILKRPLMTSSSVEKKWLCADKGSV